MTKYKEALGLCISETMHNLNAEVGEVNIHKKTKYKVAAGLCTSR
jgi:hypothetical protein